LLDADLLGQVSVALILESKPSDLDKVVERIRNEEIVRQVYILSDSRAFCLLSFYNQIRYQRFLESLSQIPEITKMDTAMVLKVSKESPRAALTDEAGLLIRCYYCGHMIHDEGVKIKLDGKYHYLCCGACEKLYREKYEKLKKSAGGARPFGHEH